MKKLLIASAVSTAMLAGTLSASIPGLPGAHVAEAATKQLSKGIGGRAYINNTGSVFTAKIKLPRTTEVKNATAYIYSGFSAKNNTEADIGLQYSQYKVWKPVMKVGSKNKETYIEGKDKFTYKKGFKPGSTVQITIYKNLNGNTRATFWGTNNDGYTGRIIMEIKNTKIGTLKKWKTLATAAIKSDSKRERDAIIANFSATFSDIKIDNKAAKPVADIKDFAKVSPSGNNVKIAVKKK